MGSACRVYSPVVAWLVSRGCLGMFGKVWCDKIQIPVADATFRDSTSKVDGCQSYRLTRNNAVMFNGPQGTITELFSGINACKWELNTRVK